MQVGFKIQIYPTKGQEKLLLEYCKISHNLWNFLVSKYQDNFPVVGAYGIKDYNTEQLISEFGVKNIPTRIVLGVIISFCKAFKRFYNWYRIDAVITFRIFQVFYY